MPLLKKITLENPCGDDIKYHDKYIEIETEVEKNFNVSNTGETKWDIVITKCEDLLTHYSKDLKLLSYWLYAQRRLNDWNNFLASFEIYTKLLETYHKELHPKSEKRKIKIFEWLDNVLENELSNALDEFTKDQLIHLQDILHSLEKNMPLTIQSGDTFFKDSQKKCAEIIQQTESKIKQEQQLKEANEEVLIKEKEEETVLKEAQKLRRSEEEETLAKFSSSSTSRVLHDDAILTSSDIDEYFQSIVKTSRILLKKAPSDYFSYKLLFSLGEMLLELWLDEKASVIDDFVPSNDIIHAARELESNHTVSIEQLDALIEQLLIRPTWIEGYYIVAKILYKLTRKQSATKLEDMLFHFLYQEENLLNKHKLIPETMREWMEKKMLSLNTGEESSVEYQHAYQEVLKVKKEQSEQNALILLENYYQKSKNKESRFRWKLLFVDFALEIGDKKLALSLLLELEKLIEIHTIDQWQPELAIATYEMILKPIFLQEVKDEVKERIYNKLSILDIKKVIKLH